MSIVHCKHGISIREECPDCNDLWDARPKPVKSGLVISKTVREPAKSDYLYAWCIKSGKYALDIGTSALRLWLSQDGEEVYMKAVLSGKTYSGKRDTLEEAFRAICTLLRREHPDIFWRIDARVVVDNWRGELPCIN